MGDAFYFKVPNFRPHRFPLTAAGLTTAISFVSTKHAELLGILNGVDSDRDCGWVILSLNLRIIETRPPTDAIDLETWVTKMEGAILFREFRFSYTTAAGERRLIAEAEQSYVLFDRRTRRPAFLPRAKRDELIGHPRNLNQPLDFHVKIDRRKLNSEFEKNQITLARRTVDELHIDQNGHLNNGIYLEWLEAQIDDPTAREGRHEIAIEFLREAKLGDCLEIKSVCESNAATQGRSYVFRNSSSGEMAAFARTTIQSADSSRTVFARDK